MYLIQSGLILDYILPILTEQLHLFTRGCQKLIIRGHKEKNIFDTLFRF